MSVSTRRVFIAGGICGIAAGYGAAAVGRVSPSSMLPLVPQGHTPVDEDEKGIWQNFERLEEEISSSNLLLRSPEMHDYTTGVLERILGVRAKELRVYIVHDPDFNASMAPNGMTIVHTGLLVRLRNEAQFAAVLGHESGHYLRHHSIDEWRNRKNKTAIMAFVAVGAGLAAGITARAGGDGRSWIDMANSINSAIVASLFSFSREQESEADAYGLRLLVEAGYPPRAAAEIWHQVMGERLASAAARGKRYHDHSRSASSTHPADDVRMLDLTQSAKEMESQSAMSLNSRDDGRARWIKVIAPLRSMLMDEQIKLNDPGASLYMLEDLASDGWDGTLRYFEGEVYRLRDGVGDADRADAAYALAVAQPDAPPEAWRAHGYALIKGGHAEEGHKALSRYLDLKPQAADAAMIRFSLN